ncbi:MULTISPECIES: 50S ribosomal protein L6 [Persicobacter]|uniref:Large ribosomal subunit protein uL6 n=1 Tax=Persicobacter diffluens TaxID=981 RepID=A0AAN5AM47_9BACT|nr:50S ribosomal protein L6 [Persicobacter sp. CCB-QB2]GJM62051.1 50S ribosomal protein L6 [Persicobacter diffluens]
MSRIGKKPITIPAGVSVEVNAENVVTVKGPKGTLSQEIDRDITVEINDNIVTLSRPTDQKRHKALHGLYRSLVNNMVVGVAEGFKKTLELVGVGYKATSQGKTLELNLGYSHSIFFGVPAEVEVKAETAKGKNPIVTLESADKQLLGQVTAKIKSLRPVEPYKGKGIREEGQYIRRKAGKTAAKK